MASGHVNRTNRPNTWLHRPTCKREEKPCQLGAVHTWHKAALRCAANVWTAIGGEADIGRAPQACRSDAIDPQQSWAGLKSRSAAVSRSAEVCYPFRRKHGSIGQ